MNYYKLPESAKCPVCGKHIFTEWDETCPICNWTYSFIQEEFPDDKKCENVMSLNEARKAYAEGREIY